MELYHERRLGDYEAKEGPERWLTSSNLPKKGDRRECFARNAHCSLYVEVASHLENP